MYLVFRKRRDDVYAQKWIGFMHGNEVTYMLMDWNGVSDRLTIACLKTQIQKTITMNTITNQSLKEQF